MVYKRTVRVILCVLLSMLIMLMPVGIGALADETEEFLYNGNIYYQINEQDEVVITRSRASVTEAEIPAEIDGMAVTEIMDSAFRERTRLTTVVLPDTVRTIGDYAFHGCTRLTTVVIPDTVRIIGDYAFNQCSSLENIEIPPTVEYLGWSVLKGTPWLDAQPDGCIIAGDSILIAYKGNAPHVTVPDGVKAIAGCAFENCSSIMSVDIPGSVRIIGGLAFSGCSKLTECVIPDGTVSIGAYAFNWCTALQKIEIADSVSSIGNHAFVGCSSLISVKLPDGLQRIEIAAFYGCTSLTKVVIPCSVKEISNEAFAGCVSLSEITLRSTVTSVGADAFSGCTGLQKLVFFNSSCSIADSEATVAPNAVIYGLRESTAQHYAHSYSRQFVLASPLAGDINEDGKIDLNDAGEILSLYARNGAGILGSIRDFELLAGDMDENGAIGIEDAAKVLEIYASNGAA